MLCYFQCHAESRYSRNFPSAANLSVVKLGMKAEVIGGQTIQLYYYNRIGVRFLSSPHGKR